jgi:hypothetical protein
MARLLAGMRAEMRLWVTLSFEEDHALRDIARKSFELKEDDLLTKLLVYSRTTTDGVEKLELAVDFDFTTERLLYRPPPPARA